MNLPAPKVFHQVTLVETGEVYRCREDETLLAAGVRRAAGASSAPSTDLGKISMRVPHGVSITPT